MDFDLYNKLLPGYLDALPDMEITGAEASITDVQDVVADIRDWVDSLQGTSSMERSKGYYHPSAVASEFFCPFEAVQPRLKVPSVHHKDLRSTLILDEGTALHGMLQGYCANIYGDAFQAEVPAKCEQLKMAGSCDGLLSLKDRPKMVLEFKSISTTDGMRKAKPAHVLQAHCYEFMLGAPMGAVVYFDKANNGLAFFPHVFNFDPWQAVVDRIVAMELALAENRMPSPAPHRFCATCSYQDICPAFRKRGEPRGHDTYHAEE